MEKPAPFESLLPLRKIQTTSLMYKWDTFIFIYLSAEDMLHMVSALVNAAVKSS